MPNDSFSDTAVSEFIGAEAQSILNAFEKDWREMCGNTQRPTHEGISAHNIMQDALPYAFVLKRTAPGQARIRVAGQKVIDVFDREVAAMSFGDLFSEDSRSFVTELMEASFTLPAVVSISLIARRSLGRRPVHAQVLLLPMRDPMGDVSRIMGALVTNGTPCPHPLKFDVDHSRPIRCDAQEGHFPDRRYRPRQDADVPKTRDHLRLVVDNT